MGTLMTKIIKLSQYTAEITLLNTNSEMLTYQTKNVTLSRPQMFNLSIKNWLEGSDWTISLLIMMLHLYSLCQAVNITFLMHGEGY